jgi:hypothetical protein
MTNSTDSTRETWTAAIRYITGRKSAEEALGFLAHVSGLLDADADPAGWGAAVAKSCVPYLGSAVSIDVTGLAEPVTAPDDRFDPALHTLREAASLAEANSFVVSEHEKLAGTGRALPDGVSDELVGSAVVVRLTFRGRTSGSLALLRTPQHPMGALGPSDLALISELAARLALGNALTEVSARASTVTG